MTRHRKKLAIALLALGVLALPVGLLLMLAPTVIFTGSLWSDPASFQGMDRGQAGVWSLFFLASEMLGSLCFLAAMPLAGAGGALLLLGRMKKPGATGA